MTRELVERLREAIGEAAYEWAQYVEVDSAPRTLVEHMEAAFDKAAAALEAKEGYVLVPREPTVAMMKAGELGWCHHDHGNLQGRATQCYRAMLAAAPKEPTDG